MNLIVYTLINIGILLGTPSSDSGNYSTKITSLKSHDYTGSMTKSNSIELFSTYPLACASFSESLTAAKIQEFKGIAAAGPDSGLHCGDCIRIERNGTTIDVVVADMKTSDGVEISIEYMKQINPDSIDGTGAIEDVNFELLGDISHSNCNYIFSP